MTIGIFSDDFEPFIGGMGRYLVEVTQRLPAKSHRVFSPGINRIPNHTRVSPIFHALLRNISYSVWLNLQVNRMIDRYALTRINIQCGPGGIFLLKKLRVPVVATCYHTWWQQSRYIPSQSWKRVFVPLERRTYRMSDRIVCISEDSRSVLAKNYRIPANKVVVIPPGVDTDRFFPIPGIQKMDRSLLYVGRIDQRKGVDFLIRSMPAVAEQMPDVKLFVGGTGKDLPILEHRVRCLGLERNVKFLGFIPDPMLNTWYNQVAVVVIPSVFEGFGLTVVEAMAAGTSVIGTRVDSIRQIIQNETSGFLVNYGDTADLSRKIVRLLGDGAMRNRFRRNALQRVRTLYSWDVVMKNLGLVLLGV